MLNYPGDWFVPQAGAAGPSDRKETVYTGKASYYEGPSDTTSSGERFDPNAMAGAMTRDKVKHLPTTVTVSHGDVSIDVRINDRGPFLMGPDGKVVKPYQPHRTRVIDLTPAAFKALFGNKDIGVGEVQVRVPK